MKIRVIILLAIGLIAAKSATAQIAGYCGKKYSIRYDNFCRPVYSDMFDENDPAKGFFIRARHAISFEMVHSRKSLVGVSLQAYKFTPGVSTEYYDEKGDNHSVSGYYSLVGYNLAVYQKRFGENWIAPLGGYFRYGLMLNYVTIPNTDNLRLSDDNDLYGDGFRKYMNENGLLVTKIESPSFFTVTPVIGFGSQRVYFNRIIVDLGVEFGITAIGLSNFGNRESMPYFEREAGFRVFRSNLMSFCFGVGYLF